MKNYIKVFSILLLAVYVLTSLFAWLFLDITDSMKAYEKRSGVPQYFDAMRSDEILRGAQYFLA